MMKKSTSDTNDINNNNSNNLNNNQTNMDKNDINNNPLLTPLLLDSSALDINITDKNTFSALNNTLIVASKNNTSTQRDVNISINHPSNNNDVLSTFPLSKENINTPISVSTIFNRYNNLKHQNDENNNKNNQFEMTGKSVNINNFIDNNNNNNNNNEKNIINSNIDINTKINTKRNINNISFSTIDMDHFSESALTNIQNFKNQKENLTSKPLTTTISTSILNQQSDEIRKLYPNIVIDNTTDLSTYFKNNHLPSKTNHSTLSTITSPSKVTTDINKNTNILTTSIISNKNFEVDTNSLQIHNSNIAAISPANTFIISNHPSSSSSSSFSYNSIIAKTTSDVTNPIAITKNNRKGKTIKGLDNKKKSSKSKSKEKNNQETDENCKTKNIFQPPYSEPSNIFTIKDNNKILSPNINIASPSPTGLSFHLNQNQNISKLDVNDTNLHFKSLPPPSISSNISIIHGSLANSNLSNSNTNLNLNISNPENSPIPFSTSSLKSTFLSSLPVSTLPTSTNSNIISNTTAI
eukprot:jgi/Orpsp1_1/1192081/evm.model.d7180000090464.1